MSKILHRRDQAANLITERDNQTGLAESVALAFVGSVVPDKPEFDNPNFSRAGTLWQQNLLVGLKQAGLSPSLIVSLRPMVSFLNSRKLPGTSRLWACKERIPLPDEMSVTLMPYLNLPPIKQIMVGIFTVWELLCWRWRTRKVLNRVVYSYNLTVPPGLFTFIGARLIGAKTVVSLNDIDLPGQTVPDKLFFRLDYFCQRWLIPRFDGRVVVSDTIVQDFAPQKPYVRIEGGITPQILERTRMLALNENKNINSTFTILATGSLTIANGVLVLLEAFSMLKECHYRLRIAGGGLLESEVREAMAKDSRIEFCGFVTFNEVLDLYKTANVLVNMRLTEAVNTRYYFPSKLMEYLASGVPVITTRTGHVEEEFIDFCYLLPDETPQSLAEMIRKVAGQDQQERSAIGYRAREYMAANKTWNAQGRRIAGFIRETVLKIKTSQPS